MYAPQKVRGRRGAADELNTPIVALGGGYLPYLPKTGAYRKLNRETFKADSVGQPYTRSFSLYKNTATNSFTKGKYVGNYILHYYYDEKDLGESEVQPKALIGMNQLSGNHIVDQALGRIAGQLNRTSEDKIIPQQKLKSIEEQVSTLGFGQQKATDSKGNPVDVDLGDSLHQVSYTRFIGQGTHHGIQKADVSGRYNVMSKAFTDADSIVDEDEKYKAKARAALDYYRGHLRDVNAMFAEIQLGGGLTASQLKKHIPQSGKAGLSHRNMFDLRNDPRHAQMGKKNSMAMRIQSNMGVMYMQRGMMDFNRTALSNFPHYSQGVYYHMPLNDPKGGHAPVHGKIGKFLLKDNPIQWDLAALNEAHVHYGLDSTTVDILNQNAGFRRADVNNKRTMAAILGYVKASGDKLKYGTIYSGEISKKLANHQRVYATIDVAAATIDLADIIHSELAPFIRDGAMGATKSFKANELLGGRQRVGQGFWGLPYLSIFDGRAMRYGIGFDLQ